MNIQKKRNAGFVPAKPKVNPYGEKKFSGVKAPNPMNSGAKSSITEGMGDLRANRGK